MRSFKIIMMTAAALTLVSTNAYAQADSTLAQEAGQPSQGQVLRRIEIKGNQRIEESTILTYLGLREGEHVSQYDVDTALKNLFATGFFADANIDRSNAAEGQVDLVVNVIENPLVNKVVFEGNKEVEDKDLNAELELKARSIYTRTKLQNDVKRILDIYRRGGRYSAQVNPKVIELDQNRLNLVYEIQEGPVAKVQKISFIGNENFDNNTLEKVIRTEETRWYKFFTSDDKYDQQRLQYDQELLRRFYTSAGFADFQVKSAIAELSPEKDAFYVTFTVEEGKRYDFGNVQIVSGLKGVNVAELQDKLQTKQGEIYNSSKLESTIDALTKELGNRGFAFVDIDPRLKRDPKKRTIDVTYAIKEGPRVYVEKINIIGNVRTLDEVIRREFRLAEGDPYSTSKIARSEQRLNNLGFFEKVKISTSPGDSPDKVVINVQVQEKSTGEISIGGGFSTTEGPLAQFGIKETNLLGRGQDLRFNAAVSAVDQQYDISFTEPYFMDRELAAGFDLFRTELYTYTGIPYDSTTTGLKLRMGYALSEQWKQMLNYTIKQTDITNIQAGASTFIVDQAGTWTESSVGQALSYDNRDNKFTPTTGEYFRLNNDVAGLGGDAKYLRTEVHASYYYPVAPKWTFSLSGAGGYIFGLGQDIRIEDRFFLGGDSFRGFEPYGIGPHASTTGDSLGGNMYYTITPELTFPLGLPDDLGFLGSIFVDAGSLWDVQESGPGVVDPSAIRMSAGVGVSWSSPFGPIRVNLSPALIKEKYDSTQIFQFNFGTRF
ncbi:MAG TPA: outer membrane protein assembly factor BamA [Rickettsiales bacterium]|nr:outer membrane protein assembly factor BamA [Rickettsiales bacterium]